MQLPRKLSLGAAWLFTCICSSLAQDIDTSFDVQGSCTPEQRGLLNQFVIETLGLVDTALQGSENVMSDDIMQENLRTYLGAKQTPANRDTRTVSRGSLTVDVRHLPEANQDSIARANGGNKNPGDPALDTGGQQIQDQSIRDRFGNQLGIVDGKQQYAYWTDEYKAYSIDDDADGEVYCESEDNQHSLTTASISDGLPNSKADPAESRKNPDNCIFSTLSYWYWPKRRYGNDVESRELAANDQRGITYSFVDGTASDKAVKS
ncbi:MAG: hypothetical protein Q9205_003614 [Flavoplaca limonia]